MTQFGSEAPDSAEENGELPGALIRVERVPEEVRREDNLAGGSVN